MSDTQGPGTGVGLDDPLRRRRYLKPPVVEAIARLQWREAVPWSFTTPGVLYESLKDQYGEEPRAQSLLQAGLFAPGGGPTPEDGATNGPAFEMRTGPQRILFSRSEGSRLLGVSPTDFSVHGLPPYEGWESLEQRLQSALAATPEIIGEGREVAIVGLRYINRIELCEPAVQFDDYLTIGISYPPGYPSKVTGFLDRVEMEYADEDVRLALTWASIDAPEGSSAFVIDLDLYATISTRMAAEDALDTLRDLKVKEGRAFEALLTDKIREQFVEVVE